MAVRCRCDQAAAQREPLQVEEVAVVVGELDPHQTNLFVPRALRIGEAMLDCVQIKAQFAHAGYLTSAKVLVGQPAYLLNRHTVGTSNILV